MFEGGELIVAVNMSGYKSYLTHSLILFSNDKVSCFQTQIGTEQCAPQSVAKMRLFRLEMSFSCDF